MKMKESQLTIKRGSQVALPATYEGETEDGLAIVSIGTTDNYILTFDPKDVAPRTLQIKA